MDLKKKTAEDLKKTLLEKRTNLRDFRFGLSGSKAKNVKKGREIKKDIARVLTEVSSRKFTLLNGSIPKE